MGWSDAEMSNLKTGDKRLDNRVKKMVERLAASSDSSFPSCFKTRAELIGAYRLFNNEFVTPEKILKPHHKCVAQTIRVKEVILKGKTTTKRTYDSVKIHALLCVEEAPPKGVDSVSWLLLTTLPIFTKEEALKIVQYYLCRWEIETFFNVLKNGCKVEERELQIRDRLETMITMFMIVAWRVMFLMNLGRQDSNRSSAEVFEEVEWKSVCTILNKQVPNIAPKLGEFMIMIGMLGGYQKRKSPPGAQVIWKGLKRMADYVLMWNHIHANLSTKNCV
jgi:hypothetical protein